jgi:esterase/lipase
VNFYGETLSFKADSVKYMSKTPTRFPIESLLSARRLQVPQLVKDYIYFISDMSGRLSLYRMKREGSIPEPLLPPTIALQNPHLVAGASFHVVPTLDKILVSIDKDGDENYQPCFVPLTGGFPKPIFGEKYAGQQVRICRFDRKTGIAYLNIDDRKTPDMESLQVNLETMKTTSLGKSKYTNWPVAYNHDHSQVILMDGYTANDEILFLWKKGFKDRQILYGTPLEKREAEKEYPLLGLGAVEFIQNDQGLLFRTSIHDDMYHLGYLDINNPNEILPVPIKGIKHTGTGELNWLEHIVDNIYLLYYNIDGCSWIYQTELDSSTTPPTLNVTHILMGEAPLAGGVEQGFYYWIDESTSPKRIDYITAFTTATSPAQLFLITPQAKTCQYTQLSYERILGIDEKYLAPGEDSSYTTFDGLRISARLYLPAKELRFKEPYPLILYIHGGPQSQERPDFTWFSMPLIQFLTLNGFAVYVPNVRGSTGYGQKFMKLVDHDWGGDDAKDHIAGLKKLEKDKRIDSSRRGVTGRSYGGYMTLWLAANYPDLWKASCDMFGPYNLLTFLDRLPETWKTYFYLAIGHPEKDKEFLTARSPQTHFHQVKAPMLVIQGKNDPRVVEAESADVVEGLRNQGVNVEYLVFEDEGHGVEKFKNQVIVYNRIVDFFKKHLIES